MRAAPRAALAAACLAAAALGRPAAAYVRTSDPDTHVEIAWPVPVVGYQLGDDDLGTDPVTVSPTCAVADGADPVEAAVRASFDAWTPACADGSLPGLRFAYGGRIGERRTGLRGTGENLVVMRQGWCSALLPADEPCMNDPDVDCGGIYGCFEDHGAIDRSTVALTTVLYDPVTGRIFDADMELNGWDGVAGPFSAASAPHGFYFTCERQPGWAQCTTYGQGGCFAYDLQNTITHEAGHVVGLAHPCGDFGTPACTMPLPPGETVPYDQRTMYPTTAPGDVAKRTLSGDDVAGVCAAYPAASGCGTAGSPGTLAPVAVLAALALVRSRARRRTRPPDACRR